MAQTARFALEDHLDLELLGHSAGLRALRFGGSVPRPYEYGVCPKRNMFHKEMVGVPQNAWFLLGKILLKWII